MYFFRRNLKLFSLLAGGSLLWMTFSPRAYGITGHDSMPEYRSFEPVSTTNMVNLFDGSFTYNIPLLEVPNGYPISLSYHSNSVNNEAQASWVGLGWTLNPGAINRVKRGFPDDFKEKDVTYHNRMEANYTIEGAMDAGINPELFSGEVSLGLNLGMAMRYNNYSGIRSLPRANVSFKIPDAKNVGFSYATGGGRGLCGFSFNPPHLLARDISNKSSSSEQGSKPSSEGSNSSKTKHKLGFNMSMAGASVGLSQYLSTSFNPQQPRSYPIAYNAHTGIAGHIKLGVGPKFLGVNLQPGELSFRANYLRQKPKEEHTPQANGYMYSERSYGNEGSVMDYHTENENTFEVRDLYLGFPVPDNDIFNVSGEVVGGSFRAFRSSYGYYRKNDPGSSETYSFTLGLDAGVPVPPDAAVKAGVHLGGSYHATSYNNWGSADDYKDNYHFGDDEVYASQSNERFFFRFSGELGEGYDIVDESRFMGSQEKLDAPMAARLKRAGIGLSFKPDMEHVFSGNNDAFLARRIDRQFRSTYIDYSLNKDWNETIMPLANTNTISYQTEEKNLFIHDCSNPTSCIIPYEHNIDPEQEDLIGEFTIHNASGQRCVYGLPIYARNEKQLSYSLKEGQYDFSGDQKIEASVTKADEIVQAKRKLGYESEGYYATQHLLTQITGADYIDRTYNGPTIDDFGNYTRFNYTRVHGGNGEWYSHRSPYRGLSFDHGELSRDRDDMGSFSYVEKESYYMHSIASKTHVAIFTLEDREDAYGAGLTPGDGDEKRIEGGEMPNTQILKYLKRIDLYALDHCELVDASYPTSGFYKPKQDAKPIKSVHFDYEYELCQDLPNNINNGGKLTLKRLWFTYNGKIRSKLSPYEFWYNYPNNPDYPAQYAGFKRPLCFCSGG